MEAMSTNPRSDRRDLTKLMTIAISPGRHRPFAGAFVYAVAKKRDGAPKHLPPAGLHVPPELKEIHKRSERMAPSHILTGRIAVLGARSGQTLEVRILDVALRQDWVVQSHRTADGRASRRFRDRALRQHSARRRKEDRADAWGLELPLHPFFGVMGVAPPRNWSRITSLIPRCHEQASG
jgi:hypothetical protein